MILYFYLTHQDQLRTSIYHCYAGSGQWHDVLRISLSSYINSSAFFDNILNMSAFFIPPASYGCLDICSSKAFLTAGHYRKDSP